MIKIRVSAKDIKNGERDNCSNCPVALAVRRVFDADETIEVDGEEILIMSSPYCDISLPPIVRKFVSDFDAGMKVKPFTFYLPLS